MILGDAHVHLHDCFDSAVFIEGAYANFDKAAAGCNQAGSFIGVLLFTEGSGEHGFDRLLEQVARQRRGYASGLGAWKGHETEESASLYLTKGADKTIVIVAGRQVVTRERLEVLALGTRQSFEEKASIEDLIHHVAGEGALPVIPWGFGKWTGARGKHLRRLVEAATLPPFFLGDSATRPSFLPRSPIFSLAEERGIRNLPGSDPLPFKREAQRAGRCGFILHHTLDKRCPGQDLKRLLGDPSVMIRQYAMQETPFRFMRNQLAMQFRKLTGR